MNRELTRVNNALRTKLSEFCCEDEISLNDDFMVKPMTQSDNIPLKDNILRKSANQLKRSHERGILGAFLNRKDD